MFLYTCGTFLLKSLIHIFFLHTRLAVLGFHLCWVVLFGRVDRGSFLGTDAGMIMIYDEMIVFLVSGC